MLKTSKTNSVSPMKTIVLGGFFLLCACGIKGPPLPPLKEETVQRQSVAPAARATSPSTDQTKKKK